MMHSGNVAVPKITCSSRLKLSSYSKKLQENKPRDLKSKLPPNSQLKSTTTFRRRTRSTKMRKQKMKQMTKKINLRKSRKS